MSEDDRIDEIIRSAASEYNRPPVTPRDEMWTAIQAARSAPGPRLHVAAGESQPGYAGQKTFGQRFAWIGMAAAAVLLIGTGIGIGRWTNQSAAPVATRPGVTVIAEAPKPVPSAPDNEIGSPTPAIDESAPSAPAPQAPQTQRTREQIRRNPIITGSKTLRPVPGTRLAGTIPGQNEPSNRSQVYTVATARHLADAEVLLTSFTLGSRDASMNRNFAEWAKGLLSNTRLLLDSPAGEDPRRARLLQDLELVLAQIVQLSPDARAEERQLVEGSIENGQVMTRLRTAIPAGSSR